MNATYVIDGTNVCWWYSQIHPKEMSVLPLVSVLLALLENGDDFFCVFDAPITNVLNEQGRKEEAAILDVMLKEHPKRFFRVTGSTRADGVVLHDAEVNNRNVITNDVYRDYSNKHAWLADRYTPRLIQGNLHPSGLLTLEKLPYGNLRISPGVKAVAARIKELLAAHETPVVSELDRQIAQRQKILGTINGQISSQEAKLDALNAKVMELSAQSDELVRCVRDVASVREELARLATERDHVQSSLKLLLGVLDYEAVCRQRRETIDRLSAQIADIEQTLTQKRAALSQLEHDSQQYLTILEQKRVADETLKREMADDETCIRKAAEAVSQFLQPYNSKLNFSGSNWDQAVMRMRLFFQRNTICMHCYHIEKMNLHYKYSPDLRNCQECHNGKVTDYPKEIWTLINRFAPGQ